MDAVSVRCEPTPEVDRPNVRRGVPADPCVMVIFGAAGDLTRTDLLPSLYELHRKQLLPEAFAVIGFSRRKWSAEQFRDEMQGAVEKSCGKLRNWDEFARRLSFVSGDATSAPGEGYAALEDEIDRMRSALTIPDNILFHLAVPPALFDVIVARLGASGLAKSAHGWRRVVVEKPFGENRASAHALTRKLCEVFEEDQIYRIDHYLGKETVQNMLVFRFANPSFEPVWNRNYIDHVQITAAEDVGIGKRASLYDRIGAVRDMIQNHLLQLVCMTAMEPPVSFDAGSLRDETVKVLEAVTVVPVDIECGSVRGQYGKGTVSGTRVRGYREEEGVPHDSNTATFAAIKLTLDNWRWADVPFYLRIGKRLTRKLTEVAIQFKPTPHLMFPAERSRPRHQSTLVFELQPEEGIVQTLAAKQLGPELTLRTVTMDFRYAETFGVEEPPRAYAWLLLDVMQGNQTLFARADWVDKAWKVVDPIIERWESERPREFPNYAAGSAGPEAAVELMRRDGRQWRVL
jgi:glucose-6-phosphate 1-dehydrogenase